MNKFFFSTFQEQSNIKNRTVYGWYLESVTDDVLDIYKSVSTIFLYFNKIDKKFLFSFFLLEEKNCP